MTYEERKAALAKMDPAKRIEWLENALRGLVDICETMDEFSDPADADPYAALTVAQMALTGETWPIPEELVYGETT